MLPSLEKNEREWCRQQAIVAFGRCGDVGQTVALERGYKNLELREQAYRAEFSVAKFLGFSAPNTANNFEYADVGHWTQVRWHRTKRDLLIPKPRKPKKRDPRSYAYALVHGDGESFEMKGWIGGDKIFDREPIVLREGFPPTYVVPVSELWQDFELLRLIAQSGPL